MKKGFYWLWIPIVFLGCSKGTNTVIPFVNVNITVRTTDPIFNPITVPGGSISVNGGSRGILIYRVSNEEFKAYDMHCTYDSSNSCALVSVDRNNNITGFDSCCGSQFLLLDGSVTRGPATIPLQEYQTSFNGSVLQIFN